MKIDTFFVFPNSSFSKREGMKEELILFYKLATNQFPTSLVL